MTIFTFGRRRLNLSIRFEDAEDDARAAEQAYLWREARRRMQAEQHQHEIRRYTSVSGLH